MNTVREIQNSLAQSIYAISDERYLVRIKALVDRFTKSGDEPLMPEVESPWARGIVKVKPPSSLKDEAKKQGTRHVTFEELYPFLADDAAGPSLDELITALN